MFTISIERKLKMKDDQKFRPWLSLQAAEGLVKKQLGEDQNEAACFLLKAAVGLTEASAKIEKAVPQILADKMRSSLANSQTARKTIATITAPALKRAQIAIDYGHAQVEALTKRTNPKAAEDIMQASYHQEIRSALAKMTVPERNKAINTAIASGDETFLSAATTGSPVLSGWTAAEQSAAIERWRATRCPDSAGIINRLRKGLAQLERLSPMFEKWSKGLVPEPTPEAVTAAQATAEAARKAAG
jgi:hypothetical protein